MRLRVEIADLRVDLRDRRRREQARAIHNERVARLRRREPGCDGDDECGSSRERFHQKVLRTKVPARGGEVSGTVLVRREVDEKGDADTGEDKRRQERPDERPHQKAAQAFVPSRTLMRVHPSTARASATRPHNRSRL